MTIRGLISKLKNSQTVQVIHTLITINHSQDLPIFNIFYQMFSLLGLLVYCIPLIIQLFNLEFQFTSVFNFEIK